MNSDKNINSKSGKTVKNATDRLLAIPGIREAVVQVRQHAFSVAKERAWSREYLSRLPAEDASEFTLEDEMIDYDLYSELLEDLAEEAGPKITEIWNLSKIAGGRLSEVIFWGAYDSSAGGIHGEDNYYLPLVIVANMKEPKAIRKITHKEHDSLTENKTIVTRQGMAPDHIYLDVTNIPYSVLPMAYKSVGICRRWLDLEKREFREGAPETFDTAKALKCAELAETGRSSKEIARELNFPIYSGDNPSGSYPLFRKYLRKGREIRARLSALQDFLIWETVYLLEKR